MQGAQPQRLHAHRRRLAGVAPAPVVGQALGGGVGEEVAAGGDEQQHRRRQRQPGQRRRAEVADDGGVGQDVERLGGQRAEGREDEGEDAAVLGVSGERRHDATVRNDQRHGALHPLDVGEVVAALVGRLAGHPAHVALLAGPARRGPRPVAVVERVEQVGQARRAGGQLVERGVDVGLVVAQAHRPLVVAERRERGAVLGPGQLDPLDEHHEDVADVAGVLDHRPRGGVGPAAHDVVGHAGERGPVRGRGSRARWPRPGPA